VTSAHRDLGLTDEERDLIISILGRPPTVTELAMFSVMWSEHCSYKSSRALLSTLPTEGERVLVGPGEGAGVIEVAPGQAVAWKIESHNHPSFVEPHNGAATGVGGIVRDITSMGARPIALLDSLRFGPAEGSRTGYLASGVVGGISSYGNAIGVPTVGGECIFESSYESNPLVNVACLGMVENEIMKGRADNPSDLVILFGSATGRDGIGGASVLASAELGPDSSEKRPSVQVGDPLTEKLVIEASLELVAKSIIAGLQDLGAGGICCPVSEMAAKSGTGIRLDLEAVHLREPGMSPIEIVISESQERMLAVVAAERAPEVLDVCRAWELEARVVGEVTDSDLVEVVASGETVASIPATALASSAPLLRRAAARPAWLDDLRVAPVGGAPHEDLGSCLLALLASPSATSARWIWEQYDHMILLGTVQGPGGDAAVIRLPGSAAAVALSLDGPGRFCYLDPYEGARLAVAEAARNVACTGARPAAVTNCLNFGNPEKPEVMWSFQEVVRGIADSCRGLGLPVTGGNVSFYNETSGRAIHPTPVIGMLGVLHDATAAVPAAFTGPGDLIALLGTTHPDDFGGGDYAEVVWGTVGGPVPHLDLERERALHRLLARAAADELLSSAHDLSSGGLAVALAESAVSGGLGFRLTGAEAGMEWHRWLFSESPSRALVSLLPDKLDELQEAAAALSVPLTPLGAAGGDALDFGAFEVSLEDAAAAHATHPFAAAP
jgi:phosphoribosylformylglycinamidine synthase subunit PurL